MGVLLREGQRKECTDNGHDFFREVDRHFHPMHPSVCPQRAFLDRQRNFRWSFTNTFGSQVLARLSVVKTCVEIDLGFPPAGESRTARCCNQALLTKKPKRAVRRQVEPQSTSPASFLSNTVVWSTTDASW